MIEKKIPVADLPAISGLNFATWSQGTEDGSIVLQTKEGSVVITSSDVNDGKVILSRADEVARITKLEAGGQTLILVRGPEMALMKKALNLPED